MAGEMMRVSEILGKTLDARKEVRKEGEQELNRLEKVPGFGSILTQLASSQEVPPEIRMSAAVAVKNLIKQVWSDNVENELTLEEMNKLREEALTFMLNSSGNLQQIFCHVVFLMGKKDFPSRWPQLIDCLGAHLNESDQLEKLTAVLTTLDQLVKKYRFESKSTELWTELKLCLNALQAPLTELFGKMISHIAEKDNMSAESKAQWLEILLLITRIYYSLVSQELPEYFEDSLAQWMNGYLQILALSVEIQSASGEPTSLDKLKSEICSIITLYAQKYEEEIGPFMQSLIQSIWVLVVNTGMETRYDSMVCAALEFLSAICQRLMYGEMFKAEGVLKTIAMDVAVKNLMLRDDDVELFEDEPVEYMKKDLEGTDAGTRRRGAIDLVRGLCKYFENDLVPILSEAVSSFLSDSGNWRNRDVVYCLVTAMASRTETVRSGATSTSQLINITDYYSSNVRSDLCSTDVNSTPILKADALKFIVTFRGQLPPAVLLEAVTAMVPLLSSNVTVIHKYVAYALERLLLVKIDGQIIFNSTTVPVAQLLSSLVAGFDADAKAQNSAYLIKAIMRLVNIIDPSTAQAAGQIATRLVAMVESVTKTPADPVHTHFLFETICLLVKKTSGHVAGGLDAQLIPLIETVLTQDLQDLIPYALQITGVLLTDTVARGGSIDAYFAFLPFLLSTELWARASNIPAALSVIESFLKVAAQKVLAEHAEAIMGQYVRLVGSKNLDNYGFQLANAILPSLEHVAGIDNPVGLILNKMFARAQLSKTPKFTKLFVVFLARFSIVRGADTLVRAMESVQPGLFKMVMEKLVTPSLIEMNTKFAPNNDEKRTIVIGFANILADSTSLGDAYGELVRAVVGLAETTASTFGQTLDDDQTSMVNSEGEFMNPFCRLSNANKEEPLAPQVANYKKYFAEAIVQRAAAANPAVVACLSEENKMTLQAFLNL